MGAIAHRYESSTKLLKWKAVLKWVQLSISCRQSRLASYV